MKRVILQSDLSAGDIVLLTAAVRDLHQSFPGHFLTDARTPFPQVWDNNPFITPLNPRELGTTTLDCSYPLVHRSNETPHHVIHGFIQFLNEQLGIHITPTTFKGDIHLSADEKVWDSQVREIVGQEIPFWIVAAGGKRDVTILGFAFYVAHDMFQHSGMAKNQFTHFSEYGFAIGWAVLVGILLIARKTSFTVRWPLLMVTTMFNQTCLIAFIISTRPFRLS